MHALRGDEREALGQVEPQLPPEHAARARAGAVALDGAVLEHVAQQVFVRCGNRLGHRIKASAAEAGWGCPAPVIVRHSRHDPYGDPYARTMDWLAALATGAGLVAAATAIGLLWQSRQGRAGAGSESA